MSEDFPDPPGHNVPTIEPESVPDSDIRIKLSAEELYQRCLQPPDVYLYVLSVESYKNLLSGQGPHELDILIFQRYQQVSFDERNGGVIRYSLKDQPVLLIQRFQEIIDSGSVLVLPRDYDTAVNNIDKMRYYHNTNGYPDLVYSNKLEEVMLDFNRTTLESLRLEDTPTGYLINPSTVTFTVCHTAPTPNPNSQPKYQLTGLEIGVSYSYPNGTSIMGYHIITYDSTGESESDSHLQEFIDSDEDLERIIDGHLKTGYFYVKNADIIYGYTEDEMQHRILLFREIVSRVKL